MTRRILEKLVTLQPKIEILTKSRLVVRDIDVLKKFDDATVGVSISTLNNGYAKVLEPKAALPYLRLEALKKCKEAGLKTYVFLSPIFPYLTDVTEIMKLAAPFVDYFMFENLNVRKLNHEKVFGFISTHVPELLDKYKEIYELKDNSYWDHLEDKIRSLGKELNKEVRIIFHHGGFSE